MSGQGSIMGAFIGAIVILEVSALLAEGCTGYRTAIAITFDMWRRRREAKAYLTRAAEWK